MNAKRKMFSRFIVHDAAAACATWIPARPAISERYIASLDSFLVNLRARSIHLSSCAQNGGKGVVEGG